MAAFDFNTVPTDIPLNVENIERIASRAGELATAYKRRIDGIQQQVIDARERFDQEARQIIADTDPENRDVAKQFAKQQAERNFSRFRKNIEESSRSQREELLGPLSKVASEAEFLLSLNKSPAQMLGRVALGDTKRTQYQLQLEGAGPIELQTAAVTAIATNDLPLAAAVVTVVDRKRRDQRPFAVSDFAERVWGEQYRQVSTKLNNAILAYKSAATADREFSRGKADPIANLSLTLAKRSIDSAGGHEAEA